MLAISQICGDSVDDLAKLHELAKRMADQAFARDIANRLSLIEPANVLFKIQVIDGTVRADRTEQDKGFAELNRLIRSYPMTASCWECASHAYEAMQRPDEALAAIGEAIELSRDAQLKVRQVKLLLRAGDTRKARNRIAEISVDRTDRPAAIRDLSDLALRCGSEEAALGFAKTQYDLEPENPDAILCLAKCLRATGDKTGATALLAPLLKRSQEAEILSARQRIVMTQELIGAERSTLANQAALGVLARQPDNLVAKRYVMTFDREQQSADAPAAEAANTTRTPWSPLRFLKTKLAGRRGK
jgi:predicted Zn-dependent protease